VFSDASPHFQADEKTHAQNDSSPFAKTYKQADWLPDCFPHPQAHPSANKKTHPSANKKTHPSANNQDADPKADSVSHCWADPKADSVSHSKADSVSHC
jgi:hypothetical protein